MQQQSRNPDNEAPIVLGQSSQCMSPEDKRSYAVVVGLIASLAVVSALGGYGYLISRGFDKKTPAVTYQEKKENREENKQNNENNRFYFDDWGFIDRHNYRESKTLGAITGDFDGDGDMDLTILTEEGLKIYENRIPQKTDKTD